MESEELDIALEELEVRLERLRALYEQYFLGIEKLEPQIPRKDVDRRIHLLRREKVRNTGKRFKLQTLIQRYNTFQQYWQRICREIENGTYKRHLIRAEKNIGPTELLTVAARRRFGREREREQSDRPPAEAAAQSRSSFPAAARSAASSLPPDSSGAPTLPPGPRRTPTLRGISTPPPPGVDAPISLRPSPPAAAPRAPAEPPPGLRTRPASRPVSSKPPNASFESLELDMDFMGDWDPGRTARAKGQPSAPRTREAPSPTKTEAANPEPPLARRLIPPPKPARQLLESQPEAAQKPAPQSPPPQPEASPEPAPPAAAQPRERAEARAARPATPRAAAPMVTDQRLQEVHQRLVEANKSAGGAGAVSYDGLAKSLRAVEAKLRAQHGANRRVDFEIVLKDGKPVVKPVVR